MIWVAVSTNLPLDQLTKHSVIDKKANNKAKPSACHFQAWHEQRLAKLVVGKQKVW